MRACRVQSVGGATLCGSVLILTSALFGGLLLNVESMPPALQWIRKLSFFMYGFEVLAVNEFNGLLLQFNPNGINGPEIRGETFMQVLALDTSPETMANDLKVLGLLSLAYLLIGFVVLSRRVARRRL